jgi:mannose-6-phosphate isomerase-like protein (cupin superfamily)
MPNGTANRVLVGKSKTVMVLGDMVTILLTGVETGGKYAMVEITTRPGGGASFLHTHPAAETFYPLQGEFMIYGQDPHGTKIALPALPGRVIHVPGRTPHGFRNVGQTVGTILAVYEPAGNMEQFHDEIGTPVEDRNNPVFPDEPPDIESLMPIFNKYEIVFIEQPGS